MYPIIQKIIEGLISSTLKNILTPEDAKKEKEDQKSEWKQKVNEMNELLEKCSTVLDGIKEKDKKENEVMKKLEEKIAALKRTASHENYCTSESPNVNNEEMNNLLKGLDELTTYVSKIPQPGKDNLSKDQPLPTSNFKGQPLPPGAYGGQSPSCSYTSGYPQTGSVPPFFPNQQPGRANSYGIRQPPNNFKVQPLPPGAYGGQSRSFTNTSGHPQNNSIPPLFPNLALPGPQHYSSQYVCQPQPVWQPYPVANVNPAPAPIYRSGTMNDRGGYKKNDLSRPQGQFQSFNNQQSQQYSSRDRKPFNKTGDDVSKESDQQSTNNEAPILSKTNDPRSSFYKQNNNGNQGNFNNNQNFESRNRRRNTNQNWKGSPANNAAPIRPPPMGGTQRPDNVEQNSGQKGCGFNNQNSQSNNTYGRDNMKPNWKGYPAKNAGPMRPPRMGTQRPDNVEQNSGQKDDNQNSQSNNTYGRDNMKPNWKGSPANNAAPIRPPMGTQRPDDVEQNSGQKGCGFNNQNLQSNNNYGRKTNNRYKPRQTTDFKKSDGKGNRDTEVSDPDILTHFLGMDIITKDEAICKGIDLNLGVSCLKILNGEDMYIPTTLLDIIDYKEAHSKAYVLFG